MFPLLLHIRINTRGNRVAYWCMRLRDEITLLYIDSFLLLLFHFIRTLETAEENGRHVAFRRCICVCVLCMYVCLCVCDQLLGGG